MITQHSSRLTGETWHGMNSNYNNIGSSVRAAKGASLLSLVISGPCNAYMGFMQVYAIYLIVEPWSLQTAIAAEVIHLCMAVSREIQLAHLLLISM